MLTVKLPYYGFVVEVDSDDARPKSVAAKVGLLRSDLLADQDRSKTDPLTVALRAVERCVCAHIAAGVDVTTSSYISGIEAVVEEIHAAYLK